jgi:hypothetical protein
MMTSMTLTFVLTLGCATYDGTDLTEPESDYDQQETEAADTDTADTEPEPEPEPEAEFAPLEGPWEIVGESMRWDDCNMEEWVINGVSNPMQLVVLADGQFSLTHGKGTDLCDLEEQTYSCEVRNVLDTTPEEDYGLDAVLTLEMTASGGFEGPEQLTLNTDVLVTCEGDACWLVELTTAFMPCTMGVETQAQAM